MFQVICWQNSMVHDGAAILPTMKQGRFCKEMLRRFIETILPAKQKGKIYEVLLCAATGAMLRSAAADGALFMTAVEAALLQGLYCPGLNALARGLLYLDTMPGCLDSKPLQPFVDQICGGYCNVCMANPEWCRSYLAALWTVLMTCLSDLHFQWLCSEPSGPLDSLSIAPPWLCWTDCVLIVLISDILKNS